MDSEDHIADLEEEARALRQQVAELGEELRRVREELKTALERKVEETDDGLPPEDTDRQNQPKKEEKINFGLGTAATEHKVKREIKPKKSEPVHGMALIPAKGSTAQPEPEPSLNHPQNDDDDVIIVDSVQRSPGKRKGEGDQSNPRPTKRQIFWVEVPPRRKRVPSVSVKWEPSSPEVAVKPEGAASTVKQEPNQEVSNALSVIRNARLKQEKKSLDDVSVFTRLSRVGLEIFPITIEDKVKELSVSRQELLSKHFGGGSVRTHPRISKKKFQKHGFDNFMYIVLSLHPHAPSLPGAPGLWMCTCDCDGTREDVRLIVRVQTTPSLWQYMGQYDTRPSDPLSTQEWAMQSDRTKQEWAKYMCKAPWGGGVRARIRLRQLKGREPTAVEVNQFPLDGCHVTMADVLEAFNKGEERLYTWSLKCRGYDERFSQEIWDVASAEVEEEE